MRPVYGAGVDDGAVDAHADRDRVEVWRITVCGEIDAGNVASLTSAFDDALRQGASTLLVDLSAVTFLDSTGLTALLAAAQRADANNGSLSCVAVSDVVERLLVLTGTRERLIRSDLTTSG